MYSHYHEKYSVEKLTKKSEYFLMRFFLKLCNLGVDKDVYGIRCLMLICFIKYVSR